jgi:hypothetical protein
VLPFLLSEQYEESEGRVVGVLLSILEMEVWLGGEGKRP